MRISDWSSDVCSSDLGCVGSRTPTGHTRMTESASPVWHPFTQHGLKEAIPLVTRARDALLHCADGSTLIDGISSWWVTRSEEHTSELQSLMRISYAVFCLKKKNIN